MMWRDGQVLSLRRTWGPAGRRCAELVVRVVAAPPGASSIREGCEHRAIAYEQLTGVPEAGERVRLEVSALDRSLGTSGGATVAARLDVLPPDPPRSGHLVKARYMPDQVMVQGADEQGAASHHILSAPITTLTLEGTPVVVADLHSSLPAILAGLRSPAPSRGDGQDSGSAPASPRTVYIMSDGGALPLAFSRTVASLQDAGWIGATVTAGQAWGGDLEAVSIHNALLTARHVLGAEVIVAIQGPGNLGTDTPWGFSGVACGDAVNAVAALGGRPVACLRVSQADPRPRHMRVSHHSLTAYGRVALAAADVVAPVGAQDPVGLPGFWEGVRREASDMCMPRGRGEQHRYVEVQVDGLRQALEAMEIGTGVRLSTMGRRLADDEAAFLTAAAAGRHAARLLRS